MKNLVLVFLLSIGSFCFAQSVPILNYSVNNYGQVQLEIEGSSDQYYLLTTQHEPNLDYQTITSLTMGVDGIMVISEPLGAFPLQNYDVTAHSIASPDDTDGDGIDDITEFNNMPTQAPLNFAAEIPFVDGTIAIDDHEAFSALAVVSENIPWAPFLNNQEFAKFAILNQDSDEPEVYFINSETHFIHANFLATIDTDGDNIVTGEVVYNPNEILPNGAIGVYSFNYSFGSSYTFEHTRKTFELLAANMPYLNNNMRHFIGNGGESNYLNQHIDGYEGSRLDVILESEFCADVDFLPFNQAEGFGFFRQMDLGDNPGSRDIVLYDALPNSLPRVGGIITSVVQTPLSHVNLRAIQDNAPNAYIREPLLIDSIADLIGSYIYYKVEQDRYFIREASLEEVNAWYENIRPTEGQIPERDLSQTEILPLDSIGFEMSVAFGAKCSNVATMRKFGFPEGTIPDGFGIPFYFYDEFMKFNNFYETAASIMSDPGFLSDLETRISMLKDFRREIKDADMPQWMLDELQVMHDAFPAGTSVRCRSSTNNEDLPGFSGAGLYTSKTQHPEEGHISKSVKQVYASMWNFRAFDERDFYRIDHDIAAMGILCHPNYEEEKSNGVGVSIDPVYLTENTFYLNTQVGESLITNPEANTVPEEILLDQDPSEGYFVLRNSNLVPDGELVMGEEYLDLMRDYLGVIHDEFAIRYNVVGAEGFGMDIEYKVTVDDRLIIKQARPWVSFWADIKATYDLAAVEIVNPRNSSSLGDAELVTARIANQGLEAMNDFKIDLLVDGLVVETLTINEELSPRVSDEYQFVIPQDFSAIGDYDISLIVSHPTDGYAGNDTLNTVLSKLHFLEGGILAEGAVGRCGNELEVTAIVTNYGESTFNNTEIEVTVNGLIVDTVNYGFNIPYLVEAEVVFLVTENIQPSNNEVSLKLLRVNGQPDAVSENNNAVLSGIDLGLIYDNITFIINADDYPQETSWQLYDVPNNELIASGSLNNGDEGIREDICVDYGSCFSLVLFDSAGDGLCCGFGEGDFLVLNSAGDTLVANDGNFGGEVEELFCPNGEGCFFAAEVEITHATDDDTADGMITITPTSGFEPYSYSIDGGENFFSGNVFSNLMEGDYQVVVKDVLETCTYQEAVEINFDVINSTAAIYSGEIKVYPNPTNDVFVIEVAEAFNVGGTINVEIYDYLGRLVQRESALSLDGELKAMISLNKHAPGSYFVRCFNQGFKANFKVIKI
jgi:archaellum component FlaF (FlaF/FlaG flagellin family)